ncbi:TPA: hypothetical protein ACQZAU_004670 [Escherichia coli]
MNDLLVERVSAFVKSPLNNPLTRGEQMELARWFLRIHEQMEVFKQLPDLPITDGQIQCATSIADDQVNIWKKVAAKEGKIDLFFELENRIHTAMLNANFQKLNSDLTKTGICDLITAVP